MNTIVYRTWDGLELHNFVAPSLVNQAKERLVDEGYEVLSVTDIYGRIVS